MKFLHDDGLAPWLEALMAKRRVVAPVDEGGCLLFRPLDNPQNVVLDRSAAVSPKWVLLPQTEELFRYEKSVDPESGEPRVRQQVPSAPPETVVFGLHPCDMQGVDTLDQVFLNGRTRDPYYAARREATAFIALACGGPQDGACFCHWTGGGPAQAPGADVLLIRLGKGYAALPQTELGEALIGLASTVENDIDIEVQSTCTAAHEAMGTAPDIVDAEQRFRDAFDDTDFWEQAAGPCNGCGACTYVCPTCQCFDITEETAGNAGRRIRTWDSCMSAGFTLEASGHNPRPSNASRWRNRLGHKFSYHPENSGGLGCTGCGRCVRACPSCVDIRDLLTALMERS
ncbi:4Fe-4S dicluster domain-containing protein [Desulfovibrio ferrophilus]|uniref:Iron-sulfur binding protein n=1 Tax=Desulfovibrio ferrophilus TaxID=241368 RepID=A0A2Z6AWB4_9BACT|nr:4Fe-4S dicluster domain-containing protein [Desulfovibrio ferrophilus]BBD07485.1 iron-sulfur binding protein [Desulfovibrio ferrophilus]